MTDDAAAVERRLSRFASFEKTADARYLSPPASIRRLLRDLSHPEERYEIIHVAGTHGKGLTAAMIAATLASGGVRTGLYTSPHVAGLREGIRIDGRWIAEDDFARLAARVLDVAEGYGGRVPLSTFDLVTATAFLAFAELGVESAVVEAGLGGRFDATNVTGKVLAVVTAIDHDHAAVLGPSLEEIAEHKLGIVRPGVAVVVAEQEGALRALLRRRLAGERVAWSADLKVDAAATGELEIEFPDGEVRRARPRRWWPSRVGVPSLKTALMAREVLGAPAAERDARIAAALGVALPGRLDYRREVRWRETVFETVVLDGGHTPGAVKACAEQLEAWGVGGYTLVLGLAGDKLTERLRRPLAALCRPAREIVLAPFDSPRSSPARLAEYLHGSERRPAVAATLDEALARAAQAPRRPLVVAGSLYLIRDLLARIEPVEAPP